MTMNRTIAPLLAVALLALTPQLHPAPIFALVSAKANATDVVPIADHHQHLFSPRVVALIDSPAIKEVSANTMVAMLDRLGIQRATVLSTAYMFGRPDRNLEDEYSLVQAENDWTAEQAELYPGRLVAFCGINPLRDYALKELARCAAHPGLRRGVKLHFGNGDIQVDDPVHLEKLREFFQAANGHKMAMMVHARANFGKKRPYGAAQARVFLNKLLPLAPDITVQIAHLAGTGPGFEDPPSQEAIAVFAEAIARGDPRTKNLWIDVASNADSANSPETAALMVKRMRQIGFSRLLYGSDSPTKQMEALENFRRLPLTKAEFSQIAGNVAPYLR